MKEAMRLHPSIAFPLERVVPPNGAHLCGYDLPGGTIVGVLAPLINRNKDIFGQDVNDFRPERWIEADSERLKLMEKTYTTVSDLSTQAIFKTKNLTHVLSLDMGLEDVLGRISRF
jgi:cytochrome P450